MMIRKSKRLNTYKAMLAEFEKDPNYVRLHGFCHVLYIIADKYPHRNITPDIWYYRELMKHKPKDAVTGEYWWTIGKKCGYHKRVKILKEIIKEMSTPKK